MKINPQLYYYLFIVFLLATGSCKPNAKKNNDIDHLLSQPPFSILTDSIKQFPGNAALYLERAQLLSKNNLHEIATMDYERSWELKPDEVTAVQYASNLSIISDQDKELKLLQSSTRQFS
ncbi:MAG: hypothetical protein ABUT20_61065 [Bacteroidota bacterium]